MRTKIAIVFFAVLFVAAAVSTPAKDNENKENAEWMEFGGHTETIGLISPGSGYPPVPGGKVRGLILVAQFTATTTGPAADFLSGFGGPSTVNANLDENMTGPIWFTFEWSKGEFTWAGACNGQFNWALSAGSWTCKGHLRGPGIKNGVVKNDTVQPGLSLLYAFGRISGLPED
jgi:hypothetical protein